MPHTGFTLGNRAAPARWAATVTTLCGLVALTPAVRRLPPDSPTQQQNLIVLSAAIDSRVQVMTSEFEAYHEYGLPAARAVRKIGHSNNGDQILRAFIDRMDGNGSTPARSSRWISPRSAASSLRPDCTGRS